MIFTLYSKENNTIRDLKLVRQGEDKSFKTSLTVPDNYSDYYVKAMIWNDLSSLKPASEALVLR